MTVDRRQFLSAVALSGTGLAFDRLPGVSALVAPPDVYGAVVPTRAEETGEILLALPEGFRYRVLTRSGERMSDGNITPEKPDGMAAFELDGLIRVVRNQEKSGAPEPIAPFAPAYDKYAGGGCTTLLVEPVSRRLVADYVTLNGTFRNCNGGATPWGSWMSGEETVAGLDAGQQKPHGYVFEVPASANGPITPRPLAAMGRFIHEAVVTDPVTGIAYMTEDARLSGFYRFLPNVPGDFAAGGKLQMLAVEGHDGIELVDGIPVGVPMRVRWIDIADPDPADAESRPDAVFRQAYERGGAAFRNLEGAVYARGSVYFASTNGGAKRVGQIWRYSIRSPSRRRAAGPSHGYQALTLLYESHDRAVLGFPDNLCTSPSGSLFMCEDGNGRPQSLRLYTAAGEVVEVVRNLIPGFEETELAGAAFSPDGSTLFLNALSAGITFAIWGPWR